jgi:hypothetical protein
MAETRAPMALKTFGLFKAPGRARLWSKHEGKVNQCRQQSWAKQAAQIAIIRNP